MKRNIVILTVLFIFCVTLPALARDQKIYPGAMGVRHSGSTDPLPTLNCSALCNPGTGWLNIDLPVIRDNSGSIASAWVKVQDRHYYSDIVCQLCCCYMLSNGSFTGSFSAPKYSSGSSFSPQTLNFGYQSTYSTAHAYIYCSLPPQYRGNRSCVISYSVTENDPTM